MVADRASLALLHLSIFSMKSGPVKRPARVASRSLNGT